MKAKGIIFDLDGTLANTLQDLKDSLNMAMKDLGLPLHDDLSVIKCINNGMKVFIERSVPQELRSQELLQQVSEKYRYYYGLNHIKKTHFYDGIDDLLFSLKNKYNMSIGVVSNKDDSYTKNIINALDNNKLISFAYGYREGFAHKPSPESVLDVIDKFGLEKEQVVFVGDSDVDVKTAKNAGIVSIGVLWGFKGIESFTEEKPDFLAKKPEDIEKILLQI